MVTSESPGLAVEFFEGQIDQNRHDGKKARRERQKQSGIHSDYYYLNQQAYSDAAVVITL